MAHCHDEHDHGHGGAGHVHDHSDDIEPALQSLLYDAIEFDKISTLNEESVGAGKQILQKTWSQRLEAEPKLVSDADEQLLITIPFAGTVRLHSILVRSSDSSSAPQTLSLYLNKDGLDFSAVGDLQPVQTLSLSQTNDVQEIPVKRALFNNTYSISLFVEDNFGEDQTELFYLGFKGDFTRLQRDPVEIMYEAAANPNDHAVIQGLSDMGAQGLGRGM